MPPYRCRQLLFDNTFHLGTGVMFPEFMLYNFDMENDERVVDIKVRCLPLYFVVGVGVSVVFFFPS